MPHFQSSRIGSRQVPRLLRPQQSRLQRAPLKIEIINTGAELMLGRVLNTHQQWLCRRLTDHGYLVSRQVAVDDSPESIRDAIAQALSSADLIITTGGLGPTSDDRTREVIAQLIGRSLKQDPVVLANILSFFEQRKRKPPESVKVQALIPEGAIVLANAHGTAPGLAFVANPIAPGARTRMLLMLPGPPRELRPMFQTDALPLVRKHFPAVETFVCRTVKTTGIGESYLEERIVPAVKHLLLSGLE